MILKVQSAEGGIHEFRGCLTFSTMNGYLRVYGLDKTGEDKQEKTCLGEFACGRWDWIKRYPLKKESE